MEDNESEIIPASETSDEEDIREHWLRKSDILESSLMKRRKESKATSSSNCQPKAGLSGELGVSLNTNPFSIYNAKVKGTGDIRIDADYKKNSCIFLVGV